MLTKLINEEQFKTLFKEEKERRGKLVSNCLLPTKAVSKALAEGNVYVRKLPQGLALLCEEGKNAPYYKLFYFFGEDSEMTGLRADKPVLLEEPDMKDRRAAYLSVLQERLERAGFKKVAKNYVVEIGIPQPKENTEKFLALQEQMNERGYRTVVDPTGKQLEEAFALWRGFLKPTDLPQEHFEIGKNGAHLVCLLDRNDKVCGVNRWETHDGVCEIRHTVTSPDCLRQGIGNYLSLFVLEYAVKEQARVGIGFFDETNFRSIAMLEKVGFRRSGKIILQYILPAENEIG